MSSAVDPSSVTGQATGVPPIGVRPPRSLSLPPAWPLIALLLFYPVWWLLGLGILIYPLLAIPMVFALVRRRQIHVPPGFLLWLLFLLVVVVSTVVAAFGVTVHVPGDDEVTPIRGALSGEGLEFLFTSMAENFIGFPPLETVVTIMLAVGLAERTGLLTAVATGSETRGRVRTFSAVTAGMSSAPWARPPSGGDYRVQR